MLNALEPGTVIACIGIRVLRRLVYVFAGTSRSISMIPRDGSRRQSIWFPMVVIERSQWRSLKSLESGTVLLEAKDGAWREVGEDEVMEG